MKQKVNIVWFKRDLRVHDHAPIFEASLSGLPVIPIYVVEPDYWAQPFASRRHWCFINDCLVELNDECIALGQALVIRVGEVTRVFAEILENFDIHTVFAHEETGNAWTFERDKSVIKWCRIHQVNLKEFPNNGVVRKLSNRDDWSKFRNMRMASPLVPTPKKLIPVEALPAGIVPEKDDTLFGSKVPGITQKGGRVAALETLNSFLVERGREYLYRLSAPGPSEKYCSRLSSHLTWGSLSVREVVHAVKHRRGSILDGEAKSWRRNLSAFNSRLSWRCHFNQKLEDQPSIEYQCMHPAFEGMREQQFNEIYFKAWSEGRTGYPFIDACMRNLVHDGWITFRMRAMLVSFASYHLWLDWRKTGYHLARVFTDYEPGIHYSQLQMQSGVTGINTLRIYNPIKQSQEHDPSGDYIKKWVPELSDVSETWIHEPWLMTKELQKKSNCVIGQDYPAPLVDHSSAIKEARAKIGVIRRLKGFKEQADKVYEKLGSRKRPTTKKKSTSNSSVQLRLLD